MVSAIDRERIRSRSEPSCVPGWNMEARNERCGTVKACRRRIGQGVNRREQRIVTDAASQITDVMEGYQGERRKEESRRAKWRREKMTEKKRREEKIRHLRLGVVISG